MKTWRKSAAALWLIASLAHSIAPAAVAQSAAETDSLVWYVEQLEHDLLLCRIDADARTDSLQIRLDLTERQLEWAMEDTKKWYHSPGLWYIIGVASGVAVAGLTAQAVF